MGKERPGRDADPSPSSSAVVMKGQSYTSTPPVGRTAYTEPQCMYKGTLYLFYFTDAYNNRIEMYCGLCSHIALMKMKAQFSC